MPSHSNCHFKRFQMKSLELRNQSEESPNVFGNQHLDCFNNSEQDLFSAVDKRGKAKNSIVIWRQLGLHLILCSLTVVCVLKWNYDLSFPPLTQPLIVSHCTIHILKSCTHAYTQKTITSYNLFIATENFMHTPSPLPISLSLK